MARSEARLQFEIWEGLENVPAPSKLLYTVVLTDPTVNHAGVGRLSITLWAQNAGMTEEQTEQALAALEREPQIVVDRRTQEVLVRTLIRNDGVADQPYVLKGALKEALQTRSPRLRTVLASELRKLPPKRPDGVSKTGKPVIYPDPHAIADKLDPGKPPATNGKPLESHSKGFSMEPSVAHGEAHVGATQKGFETLRGGGRGGGNGSSPVVTQLEIKDQLRASEAEPAATASPETPPQTPGRKRPLHPYRPQALTPAELNDTAHTVGSHAIIGRWKAEHATKYRSGVYHSLAKEVDYLLADRADPDLILVALRDWDGRGKGSPAFLKHCYDDAVRATRPASPLVVVADIPKSKQCSDVGLRIAEERRAKRAARANATTPPFLALPESGAAS